jgi:hypothetical protein
MLDRYHFPQRSARESQEFDDEAKVFEEGSEGGGEFDLMKVDLSCACMQDLHYCSLLLAMFVTSGAPPSAAAVSPKGASHWCIVEGG